MAGMTNLPDTHLPDFERPPVFEVALSIQFATLAAFRSYHSGLLWKKFEASYPKISEHSALNPTFETFGGRQAKATAATVELMDKPPIGRYWLEAEDGTQLVQFQPDKLVHNWRKREEQAEYPRYGAVKEHLVEDIEIVSDFLKENDLGEIKPNQCEVTYVNIIENSDGSLPYNQMERFFVAFSGNYGGPVQTVFEETSSNFRWVILDESGEKIGRLHAAILPAIAVSDSKPLVRLTLTARCIPADDSVESALQMLDQGRRAVVQGFASMTTPEMHTYWGRNQ